MKLMRRGGEGGGGGVDGVCERHFVANERY